LRSFYLVTICKSTHTGHDTEHVVVNSVHADLSGGGRTDSVVGEGEVEGGIVDTREVASTAGLVFLRLDGEGVDVHADGGDVGVVLVGLDQVEVLALTLRDSVVTVQLDLGSDHRVLAGPAFEGTITLGGDGGIEVVRVVEGLLTLVGGEGGVIAGEERVALHNPHKLLGGMVEVQLDLVGRRSDRLGTSELELFDQVLVRDLGETPALIGVEVDVVDIERGRDKAGLGNAVTDGVLVAKGGGIVEADVAELVELEPDLDLVVLEGDQGKGQTRVAAEPELERDVQSVLGGTLGLICIRRRRGSAVIGAVAGSILLDELHELGHVANHLGVTGLLAGLLGKLVPDVEPVTVVLVNLLTSDLEVDVADKVVANPVEPAELGTRTIRGLDGNLGKGGLEVHAVDQIGVTGDGALHLLAEVGCSVEGLFDGLHGEVGVATIDDLEDKSSVWYPPFRDICTVAVDHCDPRDWTIT
jgi:hypothetical protein